MTSSRRVIEIEKCIASERERRSESRGEKNRVEFVGVNVFLDDDVVRMKQRGA